MKHQLNRTGNSPLVFQGKVLESGNSRESYGGTLKNRWHEACVYRTDGGSYVVEISYRSCWQGEHEHDEVTICATTADVVECLRTYIPTQFASLSSGDTEGNARTVRELTFGWERLVSDLLRAPEFAEEVA